MGSHVQRVQDILRPSRHRVLAERSGEVGGLRQRVSGMFGAACASFDVTERDARDHGRQVAQRLPGPMSVAEGMELSDR